MAQQNKKKISLIKHCSIFIKRLICFHVWGDATIYPFMSSEGNRFAEYTCTKCGLKTVHMLESDGRYY